MKYIEETWDRPDNKAIASILHSLRRTKNLEESLKSVTGEGIEQWVSWLLTQMGRGQG